MSSNNDDQYIIHGPEFENEFPTQSLGSILLTQMKLYGNDIVHENAIDGSSETFSSFRSRSICIAKNMKLHGLGKGDIITLCSRNQPNAYAVAVAALLVGAPLNALDVGLATGDFKHIINMLKPKAVFCEAEALPAIEQCLAEIELVTKVVVFDDENTKHVSFSEFLENQSDDNDFEPAEFDNTKNATAFLVCSSGSTGLPKSVMLSHGALARLLDMKLGIPDSSAKLSILVFTTLYWMSGIWVLLKSLTIGCKRIYLNKIFSEKLALETIQNYRPSILFMPPSFCNRLVKYPEIGDYDMSSINLLIVGGGKSSPEVLAIMNNYLPKGIVCIGYGLTEMAGTIAFNPTPHKFDSAGKLVTGLTGKVVDVDTGRTLAPHNVGELQFKSSFVMQGYYNNPKETAASVDEEGWLHTGDLGYFDKEGFVYVTDRIKEVLKYQNWPICPSEVELVLLTHPAVAECGVVGVPHDVYGDLLVAFVLLVKGLKVAEEELKTFVAERVSDAKKLRGGVVFVEDIPMLPSGKVNRKHLKSLAFNMKDEILENAA